MRAILWEISYWPDHLFDQSHINNRWRGRSCQQQRNQNLIDNSYDDENGHEDLPRYTGPLREQDRFLPISNVGKIMKKDVPEKGKIPK